MGWWTTSSATRTSPAPARRVGNIVITATLKDWRGIVQTTMIRTENLLIVIVDATVDKHVRTLVFNHLVNHKFLRKLFVWIIRFISKHVQRLACFRDFVCSEHVTF